MIFCEILGYVGTILVLISFIPKDIKKIRLINIFGCVVWIISAVFSKSYSVMTLNSILMIVHIVHLIKIKKENDMRNNFTFCSSIKVKKLEKMEDVIDLLYSEKIDNDDLKICVDFRNLLDKFDIDIKQIKSNDVIEAFFNFFENELKPYCKKELIMCDKFEYFDFEQTQFVFDKMGEIIDMLCGKYGVN